MERKVLSQQIGQVLDDLSRLTNTLYAMGTADIQRYPDNYEVLSTDAALRAEKVACDLRHLIFSTTGVKKADYLGSACEVQGIEVVYENDILEVTLPALLPKRRSRKSVEFVLDPLHYYLSQYAEQHFLPKYCECVVCFSHIYCQERPARYVHDYDNLELKQILDVLASYIMVDDTGLLCDAYNTTEFGEKDCTRIFVMPKNKFPAWLSGREKGLNSISDF